MFLSCHPLPKIAKTRQTEGRKEGRNVGGKGFGLGGACSENEGAIMPWNDKKGWTRRASPSPKGAFFL